MIGNTPLQDRISLVTGEGLYAFLPVEPDDPFPDGTEAELRFYAYDNLTEPVAFFPLDVVSGGVPIRIDAHDTDPIPDGSGFKIFVTYPGIRPLIWYRGVVIRSS